MHIAKTKNNWRKKLEEYDENLNYAFLEIQYDQILPLHVYFATTNTCYKKRESPHLRMTCHFYHRVSLEKCTYKFSLCLDFMNKPNENSLPDLNLWISQHWMTSIVDIGEMPTPSSSTQPQKFNKIMASFNNLALSALNMKASIQILGGYSSWPKSYWDF